MFPEGAWALRLDVSVDLRKGCVILSLIESIGGGLFHNHPECVSNGSLGEDTGN
jgi:hypothetical protein